MDRLSFLLPSWYLIFCLVFAILVSAILYFRSTTNWTKVQRAILFFLRTLAVFLISVLLLSPLLKSVDTEIKKPVLAVAIDNSSSMTIEDGESKTQKIQKFVEDLHAQCADSYEILPFSFGNGLKDSLSWGFEDKQTNINAALVEINSSLTTENLGGIILVSDGLYNEGANPIYVNEKFNTPIYTLGIGDTTIRKDLILKSVVSNDVAYLGDKFTTEVNVKALYCGGAKVNLKTYQIEDGKQKLLDERPLQFTKNVDFDTKEILINASKPGMMHLRYVVTQISGEQSTVNNVKEVFVEVIDARNKILLLANATHPDLTAIKSSLESNKNYTVEIAYPSSFKGGLSPYNMIIFHNLPSFKNDVSDVFSQVKSNKLPFWIIAGNGTNMQKLDEYQDLANVKASWKNPNAVKPVFNMSFTYFNLDPLVIESIGSFNPVEAPFGNFVDSGSGQTLMSQKIGNVQTEYPLWVFGKTKGIKSSVFYGEGLWRWRMFDFMKNQSFEHFDDLLNKSVQYLTVKEDKRKFKVNSTRKVYSENEAVSFYGYLFNDSYQNIVDADINMTVSSNSGEEFKYIFDKNDNNYSLNIGQLNPGTYAYKATINHKGQNLTKSGKFVVKAIQVEGYNLTADFGLLKKLSDDSNGLFKNIDDSNEIITSLSTTNKIKPKLFETLRTNPLINLKWYFAFIAFLLCLEWFLRRYFGNY